MSRLLIVALLLSPAVASAQEPARPAAPAPAAAPADKLICQRIYETGSLVKSKRTCKTAAQWKRDRQDARDATEILQNAPASGGSGGN